MAIPTKDPHQICRERLQNAGAFLHKYNTSYINSSTPQILLTIILLAVSIFTTYYYLSSWRAPYPSRMANKRIMHYAWLATIPSFFQIFTLYRREHPLYFWNKFFYFASKGDNKKVVKMLDTINISNKEKKVCKYHLITRYENELLLRLTRASRARSSFPENNGLDPVHRKNHPGLKIFCDIIVLSHLLSIKEDLDSGKLSTKEALEKRISYWKTTIRHHWKEQSDERKDTDNLIEQMRICQTTS